MPKKKPSDAHPANDDNGWGWSVVIASPDDDLCVYRLPQDLSPDRDPVGIAAAIEAARTDAGMPEDADPIDSPWNLSLSPGEPHPSVLERSSLTDWSEGVPA